MIDILALRAENLHCEGPSNIRLTNRKNWLSLNPELDVEGKEKGQRIGKGKEGRTKEREKNGGKRQN